MLECAHIQMHTHIVYMNIEFIVLVNICFWKTTGKS